jgi:uncharacterized protein
MEEKFYEELKRKIQPYFEEVGGHEFDHTQRVYNLSLQIAKEEKIDLDVIKASALLHDIARKKQDECENKICHAEEGAKISREILEKTDFPKNKISTVCSAIETHRFSKKLKPETKEAEILQDADRLDALGAIAIGRIFSYSGKNNRPMHNPKIKPQEYKHNTNSETSINHIYEKILELKPETFRTKKAKEIAKERYKFVQEFVNRFVKEWEGKI